MPKATVTARRYVKSFFREGEIGSYGQARCLMHAIRRTAEVVFVTLSHIRRPILKRNGDETRRLSFTRALPNTRFSSPTGPSDTAQSLLATYQNVLSALFCILFRTNSGSNRTKQIP
ncbi:hypothetical protein EYB25_009113 [Talaromyces marneffei]|nr:hypothetical protein EYB25_009113 [Talaromyces marneffei]